MKGDHCRCIALNHGHEPGFCDEPEPPQGGNACSTCRYHEGPKVVPSPGSDAAYDEGCTCARMDNARGRGYMGQPGVFVITMGCPLHGGAK
jgi:hypothetical protein